MAKKSVPMRLPRRASRRLRRWIGHETELGIIAPIKNQKASVKAKCNKGGDDNELNDSPTKNGDANGDLTMGDADIDDQTALLDDVDDDVDDPDKTEVMGDSDVE